MTVDETRKAEEGITPEQRKAVAAWLAALPDEATSLKWNYNSYGMIRGVNTGAAIADVYAEPYAYLYNAIPELVRNYEAQVVQLEAENAALRAALEQIANTSNLGMSAYLSGSEMTRDYVGKVAKMKQTAAAALAASAQE